MKKINNLNQIKGGEDSQSNNPSLPIIQTFMDPSTDGGGRDGGSPMGK